MDRRYAIAASAAALLALVAGLIFIYLSPNRPPETGPFPLPDHEIYVANLGSNSILGFEIEFNGRVASTPARVIHGSQTGLHNPFDVAVDSAERIYVANLGDPPGNNSNITIYSAGANGDVAPIHIIDNFTRDEIVAVFGNAVGLTIRPRPENILVTDQVQARQGGGSRILEFSTNFSTTGDPNDPDVLIGLIAGPSTGLEDAAGIGLDATQRIHVAEAVRNRILIYLPQPQQFVDLAPVAIIEGPATSLNNPMDVALDPNRNLYVLNLGSRQPHVQDASITVYAAGAAGNAAPIRMIGGPLAGNANLWDPIGIALDAAGRIFVTQGNSLKVFAAGANGNVAPERVISDVTINYPTGIAVR